MGYIAFIPVYYSLVYACVIRPAKSHTGLVYLCCVSVHTQVYTHSSLHPMYITVYNSLCLCLLMTSNVVNTASDTSMMVSTVALLIPAATNITIKSEEVNNRNE